MKELIEIQKLRNAVMYLAQCIENGSWQNVTDHVCQLLEPTPLSDNKE